MQSQWFLFVTACLGLVWLGLLGVAVADRLGEWWGRRRRLARARARVAWRARGGGRAGW